MKYIPYLAIALCFILLLGFVCDIGKEVTELREGYKLLNEEITALRGYIGSLKEELARIERAGEERYMPWSHVIPVNKGFLGVLEEKK